MYMKLHYNTVDVIYTSAVGTAGWAGVTSQGFKEARCGGRNENDAFLNFYF